MPELHPHVEDVTELRRYLLDHYGTDWDAPDAVLASHAKRAKVYQALSGFRSSWRNIAAMSLRAGANAPSRRP